MNVGLMIYGSLDAMSGGYLYDRKLVECLRSHGDRVLVRSLPGGSYFFHLMRNATTRLPNDVDILIQDELVHPSVLLANRSRSHIPVVSLVHNLHSSERRPGWQNKFFAVVERDHLRSVDGFIFNSATTHDAVKRLAGNGKPSVVAPPGGDRLGRISPAALEARLGGAGPLRLLFLANVTPLKGLDVLLRGLHGLPAGTCELHVAGSLSVDPAYAVRMQRVAAGLATPVSFHGGLDEQPLRALLERSDVLTLPSYYEGFGIAFLEGMAFGLPAIGTTAGAIPSLISEDQNGFVIRPGDSATLHEHIIRLASDRGLLRRLSWAALQFFSSCPTWDDSGRKVRAFLQRLIDQSA